MKKILSSFIIPLALFSLAVFAISLPQKVEAQTTVTPYQLTVTSPVSGTVWSTGSQQILRWIGFQDPHIPKIIAVLSRVNGDGTDQVNITDQQDGYFPYLGSYPIGADFAGVKVNIPNTPGFIRDIIRENIRNGKAEYQLVLMAADNTPANFADNQVMGAVVVGITTASSTSTQPSITVLSPNGGESFIEGKSNNISWSGGKDKVQIGVVDARYENNKTILGWIKTDASPNSSIYWNGDNITDSAGTVTWKLKNLSQGPYKIIAVSADSVGNYCITSASVGQCNNDVSDSYFTVTSTPPTTPCYIFSTNLQLGSRGPDVAALQTFLISKGFKISDLRVGRGSEKGYFGGSTFQALKKYQKSVGLPSTGFFGPLTMAKVNSECMNHGPIPVPIPKPTSSINVIYPNGGEVWQQGSVQNITWSSKDSAGQNVNIYADVSPNNIVCITTPCVAGVMLIAENVPNSGMYVWNVGNANTKGGLPNGKYYIRVCSATNPNNCDASDASFSLVSLMVNPTSITVVAPRAGEVLQTGMQYKIIWTTNSIGTGTLFDITQFLDSGKGLIFEGLSSGRDVCTEVIYTRSGENKYTCVAGWNPDHVSSKAQIAVSKRGTNEVGYSGTFSISSSTVISQSSITVISPNGGEAFMIGQSYPIRWQTQDLPANSKVMIQVRGWSYSLPTLDLATVDASKQSYTWIIPSSLSSGDYRIEIYHVGLSGGVSDGLAKGISQNSFTISSSTVPPQPTPTINIITRLNGRVLTAIETGSCYTNFLSPYFSTTNIGSCVRTLTDADTMRIANMHLNVGDTYQVDWKGGYPTGADTSKSPTVTPAQVLTASGATFYIDFTQTAVMTYPTPLPMPIIQTLSAPKESSLMTSALWDAVKEYWERNQ